MLLILSNAFTVQLSVKTLKLSLTTTLGECLFKLEDDLSKQKMFVTVASTI